MTTTDSNKTARAALPRLAAVAALAAIAACGARPPIHYGEGTRWEVPMIAPLDGAEVVVPVTIEGKGPYLFALAPDTQVSLIDRQVATDLRLYTKADSWQQVLGPNDKLIARRPYEVLKFQAGQLSIRNVVMWSAPAGELTFRGQRIHGVLGSDLLTRTIVLDIDRDRGMVTLALTGHEQRPEGATRIGGRTHNPRSSDIQTLFRKLVVPVALGDRRVELAVDLTALQSQVFPDLLAHAYTVEVGGLRVDGVPFAPLSDRRIREVDFSGVLGQDVLARYHVIYDPDDRELWLAPRDTDLGRRAAERLGRWGAAFARCQSVGCVSLQVAAIQSGGKVLQVNRSEGAPEAAFEVVLQAVDGGGQPLQPLIRATLNPGATATVPLPAHSPELAGLAGAVSFRVVDASLHVPACAGSCAALVSR